MSLSYGFWDLRYEFWDMGYEQSKHHLSLCNVIYKIVSKVIANWLKPQLNSIISETHSAYTVDRLIIDNILIAFESLPHMKTNCSRKKDFMAFKLDMSKTYNRVELIFLEKNSPKVGFSRFVVGFDYEMYYHSVLFHTCEWRIEGYDYTIKGFKTRGPCFSLFIPVLCGRVECFIQECNNRRGNSGFSYLHKWPKTYSSLFCRWLFIILQIYLREMRKKFKIC